MTLATLQHLRSFTAGEHPLNLEPGQIAFNMATSNNDPSRNDYNTYLYVGNGTSVRVGEGGTVLVTGGDVNKGWVRYRLRNVSVQGDNIYGDLTIHGSKLKVEATASAFGELVIPQTPSASVNGTEQGSIRWNPTKNIIQSWDGSKWDSTSKVTVSGSAPGNPSEGDMWLDPSGAAPVLRIYINDGGGQWVETTSSDADNALQPGNGVTANAQNQIDIIDTGSF